MKGLYKHWVEVFQRGAGWDYRLLRWLRRRIQSLYAGEVFTEKAYSYAAPGEALFIAGNKKPRAAGPFFKRGV